MAKQPANYDSTVPSESGKDTPDTTGQKQVVFKKKSKKCTCKGFSGKNAPKERKIKFSGKARIREQQIWAEYIRRHREDLRKVAPMVDDKPPKLNVATVYDADVLNCIRLFLKTTFAYNVNLVKSLHEVNLLPGKTDTFKYNYNKPFFTNYAERREKVRQIEKQNVMMSTAIQHPQSRMKTVKEYAEDWKRIETIMENTSQYPLFWKVKKEVKSAVEVLPPAPYFQQYVTEKSSKYSDKRPRCAALVPTCPGKMVAMLYSDYVPMTVKNFLAFCDPKASLTYKGNLFYLIFQNYYCQTGDVVENRGFGGTSIYGPYFGNEDLTLKHGERGILTMYQKIPNRNESQFLITFRKLESLDGENVAFGKIIKGFHVLDTIESVGSKKTGRPKVEIYISDCDEI
ncbi:hypothetical protein RUM43_010959 [Polyplax serrata]|uniref:PPIase cyclophilin-type domain-containing protein n=1 Tax=Polyplax serrata TaxID=468196 RepID=A0AAN8NL70_POLSC